MHLFLTSPMRKKSLSPLFRLVLYSDRFSESDGVYNKRKRRRDVTTSPKEVVLYKGGIHDFLQESGEEVVLYKGGNDDFLQGSVEEV